MKILIPVGKLLLEDLVRLIYLDRTTNEFNEHGTAILALLRRHSDKITDLGYISPCHTGGEDHWIYVLLNVDPEDNNLTLEELDLLKSIS